MAYLIHNQESSSNSSAHARELMDLEYTLFISVSDPELKKIYQNAAIKHNESLYHNHYPDSGFDVYIPNEMMLMPEQVNKVDLGIKCEMINTVNGTNLPSGFYLYPRSSISKTKFRLANNVGIIDSGYRGSLGAMIDIIYSNEQEKIKKHQRLFQICSPNKLAPFKVVIVENDNDLSSTSRGGGGFGSTGSGVDSVQV